MQKKKTPISSKLATEPNSILRLAAMVDVCTVDGEGVEGNAVGTCWVVSKNVADMEWSKGDVVPVRRTLCEEKARCPRPRRSEFKRRRP